MKHCVTTSLLLMMKKGACYPFDTKVVLVRFPSPQHFIRKFVYFYAALSHICKVTYPKLFWRWHKNLHLALRMGHKSSFHIMKNIWHHNNRSWISLVDQTLKRISINWLEYLFRNWLLFLTSKFVKTIYQLLWCCLSQDFKNLDPDLIS